MLTMCLLKSLNEMILSISINFTLSSAPMIIGLVMIAMTSVETNILMAVG